MPKETKHFAAAFSCRNLTASAKILHKWNYPQVSCVAGHLILSLKINISSNQMSKMFFE